MTASPRIEGLDFARFLAFVGMVLVNFTVAMGAEGQGSTWATTLVGALEGRAAATFVVLAGLGLGLSSKPVSRNSLGLSALSYQENQTKLGDQLFILTTKRALFLLVLGLLNSLIFDADILHYYALYFFFGVLFLRMSSTGLIISIFALMLGFIIMLLTLDYDLNWDWKAYSYQNFWTLEGFILNLFFNGWHPVIPWLGFFLFGIFLSKFSLEKTSIQRNLFMFGLMTLLATEGLSNLILNYLNGAEQDLRDILTTEPIPPMPFYLIAGMSTACIVLAISLWVSKWLKNTTVLVLSNQTGRQTLTLYVAHILLGMGTLEALDMFGGQTTDTAVLAATIFSLCAVFYIWVYNKFFKRGPIESLMRRIAG
ncbi:heparan-alpha-glucosaminide N-acetyltransferase domain-containing protein [Kiloniella antarctica]|uniref:Heparan-alpha-glucosaminide N-acetyltransferase domain-containing protein n=1 Tax=Kiloniella antarctica TaxID=1550907 RepID=A0ABW5BKQ7_9PROT